MRVWTKWLIGAIATLFLVTACVPTQVEVTCNPPPSAVKQSAQTARLGINVYVDGTPSMQGFVADSNPNSRYVQTLKKLLSLLQTEPVSLQGQPRSFSRPPMFFRLGRNDRTGKDWESLKTTDDYRKAELPAFYSGSSGFPLLSVSQIDAAIVPPDEANELTIILTDLYQAQDNVTQMIKNIKQYLSKTQRQGAVGVLGIRSEFNGTIYTEAYRKSGKFPYNSNGQSLRPFYVLLLGQLDDVHFYLNKLLSSGAGDGKEAVIFSPYHLHQTLAYWQRKSKADLTPEQSRSLQIPATGMKQGSRLVVQLRDEHVQPLSLHKKSQPIDLSYSVELLPISQVLGADTTALSTTTTPQSFDPKSRRFQPDLHNASLQQVLIFKDWQVANNKLTFSTQIQPEKVQPPGIYKFEADVRVDATGEPLLDQTWWQEWHSSPSSTDGSKTHNLQNFLSDLKGLTIALMRQEPPIVGRFCYVIQKT